MTSSTPPERPAKKMRATIQIPVQLKERLDLVIAAEHDRTGRSVSYAEAIEKLLDERKRK